MGPNIFASHKHHSLFPITGSSSNPRISKDDYRLFYQEERALFTFLYMILQKDVVESTLVVGFLIWLEREGYTSYNLVQKMVNRLTVDLIPRIVDHILICLKLMQNNNTMAMAAASCVDISFLESFLDRKSIRIEELYLNGDSVFQEVFCIGREVYVNVFDDIVLEQSSVRHSGAVHNNNDSNNNNKQLQHMMIQYFPRDATTVRCLVDNANQFMRNCLEYQRVGRTTNNIHHQYCSASTTTLVPPIIDHRQHLHSRLPTNLIRRDGSRAPSVVIRDLEEEQQVPPEDRTIFLTFSKGYPIPENEVKEFFTRMFGAFIVSIHMQCVDRDDQPLYARIVARSPSMVRAVVERDGPHGKSKYTINGKHVWARKFVPRTSLSSSSSRDLLLHTS